MEYRTQFQNAKIPSLNGWRALAILLVLLDHAVFTVGFPGDRVPAWAGVWFRQGNLGVRIFFVLSGFLITHLLLREASTSGTILLRSFYLRRSLRILPVYFTYLMVLAGLIFGGVYFGEVGASWLGALTFTRNMVGPANSFTGHFWSLAVEEQFYLAWPLCLAGLALWKRPQRAIGLLLIPVLVCPLVRLAHLTAEQHGEFIGRVLGGNSILVYADSLAIGCLGALLLTRVPAWLGSIPPLRVFVFALLIVVLGVAGVEMEGWPGRLASALFPGVQALAVMVAMWASTQPRAGIVYRFLNWRPVDWLGILSYSLYIWHVLFLIGITQPPLVALLYNWRTWWLAALITAAISYFAIERPILRLKRKWDL